MYIKQRLNKEKSVSIQETGWITPQETVLLHVALGSGGASLPVLEPVPGPIRPPVHPQVLGSYAPSSIPMKSDPFWMVTGAPAALSTNMEVYCPACGGIRGRR